MVPGGPMASKVAVDEALLKVRGRSEDIGDKRPPQDEAFDRARGLIVNSGLSGYDNDPLEAVLWRSRRLLKSK